MRRQVPNYLIIGNGRVARHFRHYLTLLELPFQTWNRQLSKQSLHRKISSCTHILLLIKDDKIDEFYSTHFKNVQIPCIHFSGSLVHASMSGAHPLMCFGKDLYDLQQYQRIPFILDHDAPPFNQLLPGLPNQHFRLHKTLKAKYHALCVLSGNFSCLLWQKFLFTLEKEFNFPKTIANAYLRQQMQNLLTDPNNALTGPLVRNDMNTIHQHLNALNDDPFQMIYQSFVTCYQQLQKDRT